MTYCRLDDRGVYGGVGFSKDLRRKNQSDLVLFCFLYSVLQCCCSTPRQEHVDPTVCFQNSVCLWFQMCVCVCVCSLTVLSYWWLRRRRCGVGVSGPAHLSPPHSPLCPRRYGNEGLSPLLKPRPADAPPPAPSETHYEPDASTPWG